MLPIALLAKVLVVLLLLGAGTMAADPPPSSRHSVRDLQLMLHARQALAKDDLLARLNLVVSVRQNVVTVWGPVPSEVVAQRVVERLRKVQGLIDVRSQMYVDPAIDPLEPLPPKSGMPSLLPLEPRSASTLMGRPGDGGPAPGQMLNMSRDPGPGSEQSADPEPRRPRSLTESVSLMPPVPHLSDVKSVSTADPFNLPLAIEQVRQSDPRFRLIRAQVQDGVVYLFGSVARGEDIVEFRRAISHLPGSPRAIPRSIKIE